MTIAVVIVACVVAVIAVAYDVCAVARHGGTVCCWIVVITAFAWWSCCCCRRCGVRFARLKSIFARSRGRYRLADTHGLNNDLGVSLIWFVRDAILVPGQDSVENLNLLCMPLSGTQNLCFDIEPRLHLTIQPSQLRLVACGGEVVAVYCH